MVMSSTAHHLLLLAAFLLPFCVLAVQGRRSHRYHESWNPARNKKEFRNPIRGKAPDIRRGGSMNFPNRFEEIVPNLVPIDHFRKPLDQFKFPWKNYEEWKRHQKRIEDEIDRMLKPRSRRFPPSPRSKKTGSHKKSKPKFPKSVKILSLKKHKKKKSGGNHKKSSAPSYEPPLSLKMWTSTETATRVSNATPVPYEEFPTGGVVLAVKYYSTNDQ